MKLIIMYIGKPSEKIDIESDMDPFKEEVNEKLGQFKEEVKLVNERLGQFKEEVKLVNERLGQFKEEVNERLGQFKEEVNERFGRLDTKIDEIKDLIIKKQK